MKQINSAITTSPRETNTAIGTQHGEPGLATRGSFADLPTPTPLLTQSLSPREIQEHRTRVGIEVEVILHDYWLAFPPTEIKSRIIAGWCDELQDWSVEQVVWALRKWRNENPDKRPNAGHILAMLKDARGRKLAAAMPKPREEVRKRISPELAEKILRESREG